jgi:hypothetical protein
MTALAAGWDRIRAGRLSLGLWEILALPAALAAGWLFVSHPTLIELPAVLLLAVPLLISPKVRVVFLVLGTITVFGPPELTTTKLLFLLGAGVALVGAFQRSRELVHTPAYSDLRPLFYASFVLMLLVALSLPVAHFNGVPDKDWLRDVAPYVLLSWAPLFAFDAQSALGVHALRRLIVAVGLASAVTYMTSWYGRREIASDVTGDYGLATLVLGAAVFSFAIAMALDGKKARLRWLALGSLVFTMLATTGTRSSAIVLAGPIAILLGTRRHLAQRSLRLAVALPIAALVVVIGAQSLFKLVNADSEAVSRRVEVLFESGTTSDQSYVDRLHEIRSAWKLFTSAPVLGVGPGHLIPWTTTAGDTKAATFIDSSVGFLPDFGVVGLFAVGFLVVAFVSVMRRLQRRAGTRTTGQLALLGFGLVLVAYAPLQVPFEDKGLPIALILLLAVAAREATARWERATVSEPGA